MKRVEGENLYVVKQQNILTKINHEKKTRLKKQKTKTYTTIKQLNRKEIIKKIHTKNTLNKAKFYKKILLYNHNIS